ncbi:TRAP transporter substrate-binding protein [Marinovum sp. 2_MG-2023]|uniref:TRAP transporter substrate-binding protein n=1 Tax=unclassified Marinovum TaxID=2647166 RepID=UPI0026E3AF4B|nr:MULTISPECIES: TRAP transporter substrate-binding protein [unclassified Marinovum]MDO6732599.1 TRAP transporter substrate-binding protein [Marinovum sp. 2_MG-2023]MDO6782084.1 TRAP transporter substrate-binding protein [Marinovum sp. 1_MG-2023]
MKLMNKTTQLLSAAACSLVASAFAAGAQEIVLTAGTESNEDGLYYRTLSLVDDHLRETTDGKVALDIYPNQQLGNEASMIEGLRNGALDVAVVGGANFASFLPEFQIFSVPYIFRDYETYRAAMAPDSSVWSLMQSKVSEAELGLQLMAPTTVGSRWVANSEGEVVSPSDMQSLGLRMRVQSNPIEAEVWGGYGAQPVNMPMPEVVAAMRQGVVQAVENAPDILYTYKIHEAAKYLSRTDHSFYVALVLMGDRALDKVPADLRPAVEEAFAMAGQQLLDESVAAQKRAVDGLIAEGAIITEVDKAAFRAPLGDLYDRVAKEAGAEDLLTAIQGL